MSEAWHHWENEMTSSKDWVRTLSRTTVRLPRPEEISPSPRRADIACRTGPRELSNFLVSSASEGSSSPGWNEPSRIAVRR